MVVGLGTGSTAALMLQRLGERVDAGRPQDRRRPLQRGDRRTGARAGHPAPRARRRRPGWTSTSTGPTRSTPQFRMIKGRGGALLREKIVACVAARRVTMITAEKRVERLGVERPDPRRGQPGRPEPHRTPAPEARRRDQIRPTAGGSPYLTDGGNAIIDCRFDDVPDPEDLDIRLQSVVGVFETGLFLGLCDTLVIGTSAGVELLEAEPLSNLGSGG